MQTKERVSVKNHLLLNPNNIKTKNIWKSI